MLLGGKTAESPRLCMSFVGRGKEERAAEEEEDEEEE